MQQVKDDATLRGLMGGGGAAASGAQPPSQRASDDAKLSGLLLAPAARGVAGGSAAPPRVRARSPQQQDDVALSQLLGSSTEARIAAPPLDEGGGRGARSRSPQQKQDVAGPASVSAARERPKSPQQQHDDAVFAAVLDGAAPASPSAAARLRSKSPVQLHDDLVIAAKLEYGLGGRDAAAPTPLGTARSRSKSPQQQQWADDANLVAAMDAAQGGRTGRAPASSEDDVALARQLELHAAERVDEESENVLRRMRAEKEERLRRRKYDQSLQQMLQPQAAGGDAARPAAALQAPPQLPAPTRRLRRPPPVHLPARDLQPGSLGYFAAIGDATSVRHLCEQAHICNERLLVNSRDERGRAPLHHAAFAGDAEVADVLLQAGADPLVRDNDGRAPMHVAASRGSVQVARLLIGYSVYRLRASSLARFRAVKFNGDLGEEQGVEFERETARDALVAYLRQLEDQRVNVLLAEDALDFTCVHYALHDAYHGCLSIIQLMLGSLFEFGDSSRTDVVMSDPRFQPGCNGGFTLVSMLSACMPKHQVEEIQREHRRRSQDLRNQLVNQPDPYGMTPLHLAALEGNYRAIPILLTSGADSAARVQISIPGPEFPEEAQEVCEYTAFDLSADSATRQALHSLHGRAGRAVPVEVQARSLLALVEGNCESVNREHGHMARTPLHMATFSAIAAPGQGGADGWGCPAPVLEQLLRDRPECDPLVPDADGWTPLHYACAHGRPPELVLLVDQAQRLHGPDLLGKRRLASRPRAGKENASVAPAARPNAETGRLDPAKPLRPRAAVDAAKERLQLRRRARSAGVGGGRCFQGYAERVPASSSTKPAPRQEGTARSALGAVAGRTLTQLAAAGAGPNDEASARRRESGFVRCLELLLERGLLELEVGDNWGLTPLLAASATGSTSTMAWLLEQRADCYATDNTRRNALHIAITKKQRKAVRFLCNYDADVSRLKQMQDWKGRRPEELWRTGWCSAAGGQEGLRQDFATVWEAAREGDVDQLQRALHTDPDAGRPSPAGWTAAMYAAACGNTAILRLLLSLRCHLEAPDALPRRDARPARGRGALHLAAEAGHADACELLVRAGAPVAAKSAGGQTPVSAACSGGHLWALQSLVALRADPLCAAGGNALRALGSGDTERHAACIRWLTDLYCADAQGASKAELHQATDDATSFLELLDHGELARPGVVARVHSPTHKALQRAVKAARRRCDALLKPL